MEHRAIGYCHDFVTQQPDNDGLSAKGQNMATYQTILIDGRTGGEGRYKFTAPDDLMERTPVRAMRAFMESVEAKDVLQGHQDYEINAAIKSPHHEVITTLGVLHLTNGDQAPFMAMISPQDFNI